MTLAKQKPQIVRIGSYDVCTECKRQRPAGTPDAPGWHQKACSLRPKEAVPA